MLNNAILQHWRLDQPRLGVAQPKFKVRPRPVAAILQAAFQSREIDRQIAFVAKNVDLAAFALPDLTPSVHQTVVVSDLGPQVADFVGHGKTVAPATGIARPGY